jgi:hypothetical protein
MTLIREDQADIHVTIDGVPYGGSWSTFEGAGLEAQDAKTRPGNMGRQVAAGGPAERDDVTVTIAFDDVVAGWHSTLESKIGWARASVGVSFVHRTGAGVVGLNRKSTVKGILKRATLPDMDSNGSDVAFYTVVVSLDEQAS